MAQEIEIEFKNLLTKEEYEALLTYLPLHHSKSIRQINHYFETPDFLLRSKGSALRIREKESGNVLTLKQPHPNGLLETHDELTEEEANRWLNNQPFKTEFVGNQLRQLDVPIEKLRYGGALRTDRLELSYHETIVVLDHSSYNEKEDYELELEATNWEIGNRVFQDILETCSITRRAPISKIQRFYDTL
ncbi:CYTH domain-containing protein [Radiobacillus kanasensis]|uniref:CYTH domain-containing protein n=1 Tax=Radiobacillus kanasensis TaxID=2844358 RepID=UPI001E2F2D80|nr:CYTH domain-containing protein [Radiobacillus kanasensis]UFU00579.1 CYTH domain-containing protein [Radiobacillus kanasensis]